MAMIFPAMVAMILPGMKVLTVLRLRVSADCCPDLGGRGLWLRGRRR